MTWTVMWDHIPLGEPEAPGFKGGLGEDIYYATSGDYGYDVGWYPEGNPEGNYRCVVVNNDWDRPLETFTTRSTADVRRWVHRHQVRRPWERGSGMEKTG